MNFQSFYLYIPCIKIKIWGIYVIKQIEMIILIIFKFDNKALIFYEITIHWLINKNLVLKCFI